MTSAAGLTNADLSLSASQARVFSLFLLVVGLILRIRARCGSPL